MKTRLRFLQVFFASVLLTALTVQSWHGWADYQEKVRERHCEHKAYSTASITHTHASLEHCWVCNFTFTPYAGFEIHFYQTDALASFSEIQLTKYSASFSSFDGFHRVLRGPPGTFS
ncbi:MAG TPA: hypothetical protein VK183_00985 [Flavobacterium sp.]|nr:hypothetical protein [Flavobacterium sp.]